MPTFKMGDICYCKASKDIVKISNGHDVTGIFVPTEAIALRVVGFGKTREGLYPRIAWTYRKIQVEDLEHCKGEVIDAYFDNTVNGDKIQHKFCAGRV